MPVNQFFATQAPGYGQTPMGAAMQGFGGAIQNAYLSPLLQQQLAQQQQTTQQMQAATPFASLMAQNEALRMLPVGQLASIMENKKLLAMYPWLANTLGGVFSQQFGRSVPAPSGTVQTPQTTRGAVSPPTSAQGLPIPVQQQPTWYGNLTNDIVKGWNAVKKNLGNNNSYSQNTSSPSNVNQSGMDSGQQIPSDATLNANAPNYSWMNSNMSPSMKANKVTQEAQQEYEAENGIGSWKKATPSQKKQQWDLTYSSIKQSIAHPYGQLNAK